MSTLIISIGNPLRHDDGIAHHVPTPPSAEKWSLLQLTPELADQIAPYDLVIFVDADVNTGELWMETVNSLPLPSPLTHVARPAEIVGMARRLFGFSGQAFLCRIPARDFSDGEGLSNLAIQFAEQAATEIEHIMGA